MRKEKQPIKNIPLYNRVFNSSDKNVYGREVNELKNFITSRKENKSICITSNFVRADSASAYLYVFDTPPVAVIRISDHESKDDNLISRTSKKISTKTEIVETTSKWEQFQLGYEEARKIKLI